MNYAQIWDLARAGRAGLCAFARKLVQTRSMPGEEAEVAGLIRAEMERLDYDEVWRDEVGNILGRIRGGDGPALMMNGHMDHVDAADADRWPFPPYGGEIRDGQLWGRGAADMKGALAAMVHAGGMVKRLNRTAPGDLYVSAVVQEEVGGLGARHLAQALPATRVVVGEASGNQLRRGHRGRVGLCVQFRGRSVHAAMPQLGVNPHFSMARFLKGLQMLEMASDTDFGSSTVAPTRVESKPRSANVIPGELRLLLDWRNIPAEGVAEISTRLEGLLAHSLEAGCQGCLEVVTKELVSYTGVEAVFPDTFPTFSTAVDNAWLRKAQEVLEDALGRAVAVGTWRFATDGGHFAAAGATVLGFGPGDDSVVHTMEEHLPLDQLVESMVGYVALSQT